MLPEILQWSTKHEEKIQCTTGKLLDFPVALWRCILRNLLFNSSSPGNPHLKGKHILLYSISVWGKWFRKKRRRKREKSWGRLLCGSGDGLCAQMAAEMGQENGNTQRLLGNSLTRMPKQHLGNQVLEQSLRKWRRKRRSGLETNTLPHGKWRPGALWLKKGWSKMR